MNVDPILLVVGLAWLLLMVVAASQDWWGILAAQVNAPDPLPETVDTTLPEEEAA